MSVNSRTDFNELVKDLADAILESHEFAKLNRNMCWSEQERKNHGEFALNESEPHELMRVFLLDYACTFTLPEISYLEAEHAARQFLDNYGQMFNMPEDNRWSTKLSVPDKIRLWKDANGFGDEADWNNDTSNIAKEVVDEIARRLQA